MTRKPTREQQEQFSKNQIKISRAINQGSARPSEIKKITGLSYATIRKHLKNFPKLKALIIRKVGKYGNLTLPKFWIEQIERKTGKPLREVIVETNDKLIIHPYQREI